MERNVQVIRCRCGKTFAAHLCDSVDDDIEWAKMVVKYINRGCTVEIMNIKNFRLERCTCNNRNAIQI